MTAQKLSGAGKRFPIFLPVHLAGADTPALVDVIIEARPKSRCEGDRAAAFESKTGIEQINDPDNSGDDVIFRPELIVRDSVKSFDKR